jgi:hypothetical protein
MPIILIWNAAALPFERQFRRWLKEMELYAGGIGSFLGKRKKEGDRIDNATAGFPVFRFYNLSLTARVTSAQSGALLTEPIPTLGDHFRNIGEDWRVDREIANRAREAQLIGRLFGALEQMVSGVLASIQRFERPSAAMFDPRGGQASDLFGLAALAFNALSMGRKGILHRAERIAEALRRPAEKAESGSALPAETAGAAAGETAALPLAMQMDNWLRYVGGALLILPAAGALLIHMGEDLVAWLRRFVIDLFERHERTIVDLRQTMFAQVRDGLRDLSAVSVGLFGMAANYVSDLIRHWVGFGRGYISGVATGVANFSREFGQFWGGVHKMVMELIRYGAAVMSLDLTQVVHQVLWIIKEAIEFIDTNYYPIGESPTMYTPPGSPIRVNLGELALAEGGGATARDELGRALALLEQARIGADQMGMAINVGVAGWFTDINIPGLLGGVRRLLPRLGVRPGSAAAQPILRYSTAAEPDLAALIVEPMRARFETALGTVSTRIENGVEGIVTSTVTLLGGAAVTFTAAALIAANLGNEPRWQQIVANADQMAARAFPGMPEARPTGLEAVGRTFGLWLQANFDTLGAILGGYLRFVLDEWMSHLDANADTPVEVDATSPKKLLQRAQLGRVHMTRLRIAVPANLPDRALADHVAARFRGEVGRAYARGQSRFEALAG